MQPSESIGSVNPFLQQQFQLAFYICFYYIVDCCFYLSLHFVYKLILFENYSISTRFYINICKTMLLVFENGQKLALTCFKIMLPWNEKMWLESIGALLS